MLLEHSAAARPEWTRVSPDDKPEEVLLVGREDAASSIEEGRQRAFENAASLALTRVGIRASKRLIVARSPDSVSTDHEVRIWAAGRILDLRLRSLYWESYKPSRFWGRRKFRVFVLAGYPKDRLAQERERLERIAKAFEEGLSGLCRDAAEHLRGRHQGTAVSVGGFQESATRLRYGLSGVVEDRLKGCLIRAGVKVAQGTPAPLTVTGSYSAHGDDLLVSLRVEKSADGRGLFASQRVVPKDSVEPQWLEIPAKEAVYFREIGPRLTGQRPTGAVEIDVRPRHAMLYLDGVLRGTGHLTLQDVPVGVHAVAARMEGFEDHLASVLVKHGETAFVIEDLRRQTGSLHVESQPPGALVSLDGVVAGLTPWRMGEVDIGSHAVALRLPGYKETKLVLEVERNGLLHERVRLEEEDGAVFIMSHPPGARVTLDGEDAGRTDYGGALRISPVAPGTRRLAAYREGYEPWTSTVMVRPAALAQATAVLRRTERAIVRVRGWDPAMLLDCDGIEQDSADGFFLLPPGKRNLAIRWAGHEPWRIKATLRPGRVADLEPRWRQVEHRSAGSGPQAKASSEGGIGYADIMGGHFGAFARGSGTGEIHLLKVMGFHPVSRVGLGASLFSVYGGAGRVERVRVSVVEGRPGYEKRSEVVPRVLSLFPLHVGLVPYARPDGLSMMIFGTYCGWGQALYGGEEWEPRSGFGARVLDAGVEIGLPGHWLGLRAGFLDLRVPPYTARGRADFFGDHVEARYAGTAQRGFYAAIRVAIGGLYRVSR